MTVLENIQATVVGHTPRAICDDCITKALSLSVRQHANHKTNELAKLPGFDRRKDVCSTCGQSKMVIRYKGR